jgi:hypothetical protein
VIIERWQYMGLAPALAIEKIYRKLYRQGRSLAGERTRAETAHEFMQKLISKMDAIRKSSVSKKSMLRAQNNIELLTDLYQATLFRQSHMQKSDIEKALKAWKQLRLRLLITRMNVFVVEVIVSKAKNIYRRVQGLFNRKQRSFRAR